MKQFTHAFKDLGQLMKLRDLWATGSYSKSDLARKFNTSVTSISRNLKKLETLK